MRKTESNFESIKKGFMRMEVFCESEKYTLRYSKKTNNFTLINRSNNVISTLKSDGWVSLKNKVLYVVSKQENTTPTITLISNIKNK